MPSYSAGGSSTGDARYVAIYIVGNADSAINAMRKTAAASKETESALSKTGRNFKSVGSNMTQLGYSVSRVALPLAALGGYAIKSALSFEKSMTLVKTQAGGSAKEVAKLSKEVEKLSGKDAHGFGPNELAEALYPIRSDGFKAAEAIKVLNAASAGAAVGQANLGLTANALGGALRTYGGGAKAANEDMNILNATVGFGKFKLEELDQALTSGFLVQAHKSGIGLKEIGTALDSLARKSVPPQVEATRLQKTLIQFETTSGIAEKSLAKIGISHYQLAENLKKNGLISTLELIREHLKKVGSGPEAEAIEGSILGEAFGRSKGSANVGALLQAIPEMKKIEAEKKHYNTLSEALAATEAKSYYKIKVAIAELKKGLIELGNTLIPVVIPAFEKLVKFVQKVVEWFTKLPKPIKDAATYFGIFLVVVGPLLIFFGNLIKSVGSIIELFGKLGPAAASAEGGTAALTGEMTLLDAAIPVAALGTMLYLLGKIKTPKWLGGEGHSLLHEALSVIPEAPNSIIAKAGQSPHAERQSLLNYYRNLPNVYSPSRESEIHRSIQRLEEKQASTQPLKINLYIDSQLITEKMVSNIRGNSVFAKGISDGVANHLRNNTQSTATKYVAEAVTKHATQRRANE